MVTVGGQSREGGAVLVTPGGDVVGSADVAGQKSKNRRRRSSSSKRRAAEARARAEQLRRIEVAQKAREDELKRVEASKKLQKKIERRAVQIRLEKTKVKKVIEEKKKKKIFKGSFKKGIQKQKQFLTKSQRDVKFGITPTKVGEKIARRYIATSPKTSRIIKTNPKILNALVDQQKLTDRTIKELRIAGLEVTRTFVEFVESSPEVVKFLTVNNPGWNKKNRNTISNAITKYTPKVASWAKGVITDVEKRKLAVAAVAAFGVKQLKIVKVSPGKSLGRVGGELVLFAASGGTWRAVKTIDSQATRGLLKVGNKWVRGSEVLNAIVKKGGKTVKGLKIVGKDIVVSTKKTFTKAKKKVSKSKIIKKIKKIKGKIIKKKPIKRFSKKEKSVIRRELAKDKRLIRGVKVSKKEFKSFQAAEKEFESLRKTGKLVNKIESKFGSGVSQSVSKKAVSTTERSLLKTFNQLPSKLRVGVDKLSFTTFSQAFTVKFPVLKRFGGKKGIWRIIFKEKLFYQNTVSISMFNKAGKGIVTFSYNTIANKPIQKFRNIQSALKWGRGKSISISKKVGKDLIQTFVLKSRRGIISKREFISKVKITKRKGVFEKSRRGTVPIQQDVVDIEIFTITGRGSPVSRTAARTIKTTQRGKSVTKKGVLKIIDSPKVIERIKASSIINPVVIDTSRIDKIVRILNKLKVKSLKTSKKKVVKAAEKRIRRALQKGRFRFKGKNKVVISKQKLLQLEKVTKELQRTTVLKQSLAAASIPKRITIPKRIEGLTDLKKLIRVEKRLRVLARNKALNSLERKAVKGVLAGVRTAQLLTKTLAKAKKKASQNKILNSVATLQKNITSTATKTTAKTSTVIKTILKPVVILPRIPSVRIRPKKKKKLLRLRKSDEELIKTKTLKKPTRVFNVVIKKRGKNVVLNKRLIERDAKNFMALELDTTLIRTARLVPAGIRKVVTKLSNKYTGAFAKRKKKFRPFRIKRKKKIAIKGYIEKRKFAFDTKREKKQLSRLIKRKRKTNKRKTTRTTRRKKKRK